MAEQKKWTWGPKENPSGEKPEWKLLGKKEDVRAYVERKKEIAGTALKVPAMALGIGLGLVGIGMKELLHYLYASDFFSWPPKWNDPGQLKEIKDWHRKWSGAKAA